MQKTVTKTLINCRFQEFASWIKANMPSEDWLLETFKEFSKNGDYIKYSPVPNLSTIIEKKVVDEETYEAPWEIDDDDKDEDDKDEDYDETDYQDPYRHTDQGPSVDIIDDHKKRIFIYQLVATNPIKVIKIIKGGYVPKDNDSIKNILLMNNEYLTKLLFTELNNSNYPMMYVRVPDEVLIPYVKSKDCYLRGVAAALMSCENLNLFVGETNADVIQKIIGAYNSANNVDKSKMGKIMSYISKYEMIKGDRPEAIIDYWMSNPESQKDMVSASKRRKMELLPGGNYLPNSSVLATDREYKIYNKIIAAADDQNKLYTIIWAYFYYHRTVVEQAILFLMEKRKISLPILYKLAQTGMFTSDGESSFYKLIPSTVLKLIFSNYKDPKNRKLICHNTTVLRETFTDPQISFKEKVDFWCNSSYFGLEPMDTIANSFLRYVDLEDPNYLAEKFNSNPTFFEYVVKRLSAFLPGKSYDEFINILLKGLNEKNYTIFYKILATRYDPYTTREEKNNIRLSVDIAANTDKKLSKIISLPDKFNRTAIEMQNKMIFVKMIMSIYEDSYSDLIKVFKFRKEDQPDFVLKYQEYLAKTIPDIDKLKNNDNFNNYKFYSYFMRMINVAQVRDKEFLQKVYEYEQKEQCPPNILRFIKQRYLDNNDIITDLSRQMMNLLEMISKMV